MTTPEKIQLPGKPTYLKLAEDHDIFSLFCKIERQYDNCFLFESLGEESYTSRNHIVGFDPVKIICSSKKDTLTIIDNRTGKENHFKTHNPYNLLREIVPKNIISKRYSGGLVGYVSHDCINFHEPLLNVKKNDYFDSFKFGLYLDGLIYDQVTGEIFYYYYDENRFNDIQKLLDQEPVEFQDTKVTSLGDTVDKEAHKSFVNRVKEDICSGLIFQCEVGFKTKYEVQGDCLPIYNELRLTNPSPHMYYMKLGEEKIIGASPELLFRLRDGTMETFPLAGTTKRGSNAKEDIQLARVLLNDPKEISEHSMLVDLHRNDIGRVSRFGSVKVRSLMDIKRYSHVQHISSEIVGLLAEGEDMFSAFAANFPAGTLTGAPKIEAIKIIDELEEEGRGVYGGAIGQFCFNGDCTFAIPIRSIFINGTKAYVQTSGGNVYDSNADDEYQEIQHKFSAMKNVLAKFESL